MKIHSRSRARAGDPSFDRHPSRLSPGGAPAFLCRGTLLLLLAVPLGTAWAQEPSAPQPTAAGDPGAAELGVASVQARLEAVRAASDADPKVQAKAIELYEQALQSLQQAALSKAQTDQYAADASTAPARLQAARQAIAAPAASAPSVESEAAALTRADLEQRAAGEEAGLAAAKAKLQEIQDRLAREQTRPEELQRSMADARQRLDQIEGELKGAAPEGEAPLLTEARRAALLARRQMRRAELEAGAAELAGRETRIEILTAGRDLGLADVARAEDWVAAWHQAMQDRLGTEAQEAADEAARAEAQVEDMPKAVRDLARENSELAEKLGASRKREKELTAAVEAATASLAVLQEDYASVKQRVELGGLNETIGLMLRQQRTTLPNLRSYRRAARDRGQEMGALAEQQFENDVRRRSLIDVEARVSEVLADFAPSLSEQVRANATARTRELLAQQQSLVGDLAQDYGRYMRQLGNLDNAERELAARAGEYRDLINEHLLWIRSTKPLGASTPAQFREAVAWLASPARWQRVGSDVRASWERAPFSWAGIVLLGGLVLWLRRWARRDLGAAAARVGKLRSDSVWLTPRAVADSAILSTGWPLVLALAGWRVWSIQDSAPLTQAIGTGLVGAASLWALVGFLAVLLRDVGLAGAHFGWSAEVRASVRRPLPWLTAIAVPLVVPVAAAGLLGVEDFTGSVSRACFLVLMVLLLAFALRVLRPSGGVMSAIVARQRDGWLARARFVWAALILVVPTGLLGLAAAGYFYAAVQLGWRLEAMLWLALGVTVAHQTLMRGVQVSQRRRAWDQAKQKRLEQQAAKGGAPVDSAGEFDAIVVHDEGVSLEVMTGETRDFIRTLTGAAVVLLLWALWADVLPALGFLNQVELWHYTGLVDGVEQQLPITLASLFYAAIIVLVTTLSAKNLPGALEISVLERLSLDTGARYAFTTICRYVIVGAGMVFTLSTLGVTGKSLQWLIAALSVGLGFGLQEIVANFVSGIIILFERPFRIGDIVTVGDVSGKVAKIRIRATTIVDWDRRELVVPNKSFITGPLINLTLSDPTARLRIPIGIAYGSDVALARKILLRVAAEHDMVLRDPAPSALFLSFGDSALNMELRVFLADVGDKLKLADRINERIDDEFKEAGIEIVFPQRDVNLKILRPVEVRVVERERERRDPPAAEKKVAAAPK